MAIYFLYANKKFIQKYVIHQNFSFQRARVCAAPCFSNRAPRDAKKPFTFSFLSDKHFDKQKPLQRNKEFRVLNFPAKLQAELFDVTHTLLAPRWRRSVVEFWATLEKDFVGI